MNRASDTIVQQRQPSHSCFTNDANILDLGELEFSMLTPMGSFDSEVVGPEFACLDAVENLAIADHAVLIKQSHFNIRSFIPPALETEADLLSNHYFSSVCIINSGFDSPANPFRTYVAELMSGDTIIYHCMLSMSAAHLYQHREVFKQVALNYRTEAISSLRAELSLTDGRRVLEADGHSRLSTLLFGTLLLGMSSSWHETSSLGEIFLHGARSLLKTAKVRQSNTASGLANNPDLTFRDHPEANFLVGAIAFWEMLSSYHINQDISATDYLKPFCLELESADVAPNPWTGVNTGLFLLAAKVGTLTRHAHLLHQLAATLPAIKMETHLDQKLLETARQLEEQIRRYEVRPLTTDTDDKLTPGTHFETMARVYQLTMRLELYQVFPELLRESSQMAHYWVSSQHESRSRSGYLEIIRALAVNILTLLCSIPVTSGTKAIQLFPLVVAGSALQYDSTVSNASAPDKLCVAQEVVSLIGDKTAILHWRAVVQNTMLTVYKYVGLESAQRGAKIVENVWTRSDTNYHSHSSDTGVETTKFIYWADVMREEHLETLLG
ncbi:hypothetical protein LTR84_012831 [Exophiala bonariae]|uniref:Transcription factor domain-containing protein n=1 Tax=Exophiala bonariae TaxID=1690606 RepID=A0AAV9NDA4_9EURO|nr:hypothetical protein LTR84_012831 [Exophiala bonariae]